MGIRPIIAALKGFCLVVLLTRPAYAAVQPHPGFSRLGGEFADDPSWFVNRVQLDVEDVATSPPYVAAPQSPLRSPRFYLALAAAAAVWGISFALDKTVQRGVGHMAHSAHAVMENPSYAMLIITAGGTLIYGLYADYLPTRRDSLTGLETACLGSDRLNPWLGFSFTITASSRIRMKTTTSPTGPLTAPSSE
jgi:hypothetical protein